MTQLDPYPLDQTRIIKDLERRIEALEALVRQTKGTPVTQASGPLLIPDSATPSAPDSGIRLYSAGGEGRWISSSGVSRSLIPPTVPKAAWVSDPNSMSAGGAPSSYGQAYTQFLRDDVAHLRTKWIGLRDGLISAGLMFPA